MVVTLTRGLAYIQIDGESLELSAFLSTMTDCSPEVKTVVRQVADIYTLALSSGTINRIIATYGTPRVSISFIQHYR